METPLTCKKHPTYKALRRPTANCETCDTIWRIAEVERIAVRTREAHHMSIASTKFRGGQMKM